MKLLGICCPIGPIRQWQTIGPACGADVRCLAGSCQVAVRVLVYHHLRFSRRIAVTKDANTITITPIRQCQPIGLALRTLSSCLAAQRKRLFRVGDVAIALANGAKERDVRPATSILPGSTGSTLIGNSRLPAWTTK